jgi:imidazolonepropionase-like amidohydrolase
MRTVLTLILSFTLIFSFGQGKTQSVIIITNAKIFDGKATILPEPMSVRIDDNKITTIAKSIDIPEGATVIDAEGRTLTPGFIDAHVHLMLAGITYQKGITNDEYYWAFRGALSAKTYLMNGFTTVRDAGGNTFSLKMAIDEGLIEGPRIYPSGAMISQTAGHSDHRTMNKPSALLGGQPDVIVKFGHMAVADGVPEVLKVVREQLRMGASQIKICVSGGITSEADGIDVIEYTLEEIKAAVQAANDYNTYVWAHLYTSAAINRAIEAGVRSIEHGNLIDEPTMKLMKEKNIWLSPQVLPFTFRQAQFTEDQLRKLDLTYSGIDNMFKIAKKIGFDKIGYGTDIVFGSELLKIMNTEFTLRTKWFTPAEILKQATYNNGQILAMSNMRNPYPDKLGLIEEGAYTDILLINGNPLEDISILTKPDVNLALIMKNGKIYKNTLERNLKP